MRLPSLCLCLFLAMNVRAAAQPRDLKPTRKVEPLSATVEEQREAKLEKTLCADKDLNCEYVRSLFDEPRFQLYAPPPSTPPTKGHGPKDRERNPYLTARFGLLTPESLERCHSLINQYNSVFDAALKTYGVPEGIICGHLRIETNFGTPTSLSPYPLGTAPAFNRLVTLYVRQTTRRRQKFAVNQLRDLIEAAVKNNWDLFDIPGSSTGAIGLLQFEPSNFYIAVDGDGDGKIDLFDPADAIMSLAHFLQMHGYDDNPKHQQKAIYSYYGKDSHKYYMKAVLAYAAAETSYLEQSWAVPVPPSDTARQPTSPSQPDTPEPAQPGESGSAPKTP
jgi:membrane-bound lytic murein transglycosylase B